MAYIPTPVGIPGSTPATTRRQLVAGVANTGTPTAVADGQTVELWIKENGQLVIAGTDVANGQIKVVEQSPELAQTLNLYTTPLLDAVNSGGYSSVNGENVTLYNKITFYIVATAVTFGAVIDIEASHNGTDWSVVSSTTVVATGNTRIPMSDEKDVYIRVNISTYQDGTYTVAAIGGR